MGNRSQQFDGVCELGFLVGPGESATVGAVAQVDEMADQARQVAWDGTGWCG